MMLSLVLYYKNKLLNLKISFKNAVSIPLSHMGRHNKTHLLLEKSVALRLDLSFFIFFLFYNHYSK